MAGHCHTVHAHAVGPLHLQVCQHVGLDTPHHCHILLHACSSKHAVYVNTLGRIQPCCNHCTKVVNSHDASYVNIVAKGTKFNLYKIM